MLHFHEITHSADPLLENVSELYTSAFPENERRSRAGLEYELIYQDKFHVNALMKSNEFIGFFNYWTFDNFSYVEHFAIDSFLRSQHFGSEAIEIFRTKTTLPIVFEVEVPNDIQASRRIKFYENLGFQIALQDYVQPSYDGSQSILPMLIMSNNLHFANNNFKSIVATLYQEVYKHDPNKLRST